MKLTSLTLQGSRGWPDLSIAAISPALSCYYGPPGSGKTTATDFLAHVLYGRPPLRTWPATTERIAPDGETIVENVDGRYRLRRYHDGASAVRLTVASLDGSPVDQRTVQGMMMGLSPAVVSRLFAIGFDEPPAVAALLDAGVAGEIRALVGEGLVDEQRQAQYLVARRDALARELERRIAAERRRSADLDKRLRQLDDSIREQQHAADAAEERFRSVETALAETDARLRYRRLELNVELRWNVADADDHESLVAELDGEIARWRTILADVAAREARVRARLAQVQPADGSATERLAGQRAWMAIARQLSADLEGEVARLAKSSASGHCVCRDAHPRLRPMVETLRRQLNVLDSLHRDHQQAGQAAELREEADQLARCQAELRRHVDYLLDRRGSFSRASQPSRRPLDGPWWDGQSSRSPQAAADGADKENSSGGHRDVSAGLTAADAEQLEQRRLELEEERFALVQQIQLHQRRLKELRSQRSELDCERAALLSARSFERAQHELTDLQQQLGRIACGGAGATETAAAIAPPRASDFLAQLTGGRLIRLQLVDGGRDAVVVRDTGETLPLASLRAGERDQVYLSLSLALVVAAARHGVRLPLVLDEPFARLDHSGTAALAAVLDHVSRQGQQIIVFTARRSAADRLASLGVPVNDLASLRRGEPQPAAASAQRNDHNAPAVKSSKARRSDRDKRKPRRRRKDSPSSGGQSDAA